MPDATPILPGRVIGVLGGGQLGSMFATAASRMGYRVEAISDVADCPAAIHCDHLHVGDYADSAFLERAATACDVITFEFENIPASAGRALTAAVPVRPCPEVLFTTQDRAREKEFLTSHGIPCAAYRVVRSRDALQGVRGRENAPRCPRGCPGSNPCQRAGARCLVARPSLLAPTTSWLW